MKSIIAIISVSVILSISSCSSIIIKTGKEKTIVLYEEPKEITSIRLVWRQYKPKIGSMIFLESPNIKKPYSSGRLSMDALENGLNTTKFIRFLAGLSEDIYLDDNLIKQAQHGAVLLAAVGKLTHTPSRPFDMDNDFYNIGFKSTKSSNIHQSIGKISSLSEAVVSFCDDSDESNIDRLGHRRWILNPYLGKIGFGLANRQSEQIETYITMQVFDSSGSGTTKYPFVAWPSPGYFPLNYFGPDQAWSISLSEKIYDLRKSVPKVTLTRLSDDKQWLFTSADKNKNGKYYTIEKTGFGIPFCIIFKPDGVNDLIFNKKYKVQVNGLYDISGNSANIEYIVEFFMLI